MAQNSSLGRRIVAQDLVIQRLLSQATIVGGVYTMGYNECLVLTNDLWKKQAGGVPGTERRRATAYRGKKHFDAVRRKAEVRRIDGVTGKPLLPPPPRRRSWFSRLRSLFWRHR